MSAAAHTNKTPATTSEVVIRLLEELSVAGPVSVSSFEASATQSPARIFAPCRRRKTGREATPRGPKVLSRRPSAAHVRQRTFRDEVTRNAPWHAIARPARRPRHHTEP